jgi:CMP-2-keto-3-deoxyoctulosonic acid synthetase
MKLHDVMTNYSDLSHEERLKMVRAIREDRKISKHAITVAKKRQVDKKTKLEKAIANMSPEDKAAFLQSIGVPEDGNKEGQG